MDHAFDELIGDALRMLWQREPVTATFAGEAEFDAGLPRADATAEADECAALERLAQRLAEIAIPDSAAARIDARHLDAYCTLARSDYARRARYRNPAWYTGEANFALISLLLAPRPDEVGPALAARTRALPEFLEDGRARLRDVALPHAWITRARTETGALRRLIRDAVPLHPGGAAIDDSDVRLVAAACDRFEAALGASPAADAACGEAHLHLIVNGVHGLNETPAQLERRAAAAFEAVNAELEAQARRLDPTRTWREQLTRLGQIGQAGGDVTAAYAHWHERAMREAAPLVTPADDYALTFAPLPAWAAPIAGDLYFLFYRSPAAARPGSGSMYWVLPAQGTAAEIERAHNTAAVKLIHAVHHGSIGHHTQNARARAARSRFARIAGTDGASALALLAAGSMVEGWACYAEDLMAEVPGFYTAAESLQLTYFELRNIASCLADVRFHCGAYTLDEMQAFYRDDVAFAPARVGPETIRNSMFPGSRLMYWCGTEQIKALRAKSTLPLKAFHDTLLSFGAAPVAGIAQELAR